MVTKLKNSSCDQAQKLKLRQNFKCEKKETEKLKVWPNLNCEKLQNLNYEKTQILKLW